MKKYIVEFGIAMASYVVLLIISMYVLKSMDETSPFRVPVALIPMIPLAGVLWAVIRRMRVMDELQRKIQFEALSWAFGMSALTTFSYGFLETVGFPRLSYFMVWPIMGGFWMIGLWFSKKRYS